MYLNIEYLNKQYFCISAYMRQLVVLYIFFNFSIYVFWSFISYNELGVCFIVLYLYFFAVVLCTTHCCVADCLRCYACLKKNKITIKIELKKNSIYCSLIMKIHNSFLFLNVFLLMTKGMAKYKSVISSCDLFALHSDMFIWGLCRKGEWR